MGTSHAENAEWSKLKGQQVLKMCSHLFNSFEKFRVPFKIKVFSTLYFLLQSYTNAKKTL